MKKTMFLFVFCNVIICIHSAEPRPSKIPRKLPVPARAESVEPQWTEFHKVMQKNRFRAIKFLPPQQVNIQEPRRGNTPLHVGVQHKSYAALIELLKKPGLEINCVNYGGDSPLHDAVKNHNPLIVDLLLKHTANPNVANQEGNTPLHCVENDAKIAELFMPYNLDLTHLNNQGHSPLERAELFGHFAVVTVFKHYLDSKKDRSSVAAFHAEQQEHERDRSKAAAAQSETTSCAICFNEVENGLAPFECEHLFDEECTQGIRAHGTELCPQCKAPLKEQISEDVKEKMRKQKEEEEYEMLLRMTFETFPDALPE